MKYNKITIGIVTIEDYINYGNRLQNYALTKLLEDEGFKVVNGIRVNTKQDYVACSPGLIKKIIKILVPYPLLRKRISIKTNKHNGLLEQREAKFMEFINQYTSSLPPVVTPNHRQAMKIFDKYEIDFFVTGSDQVWNPYYEGRDFEFLTFAPRNKRLSFAASIGVNDIPDNKVERYRRSLIAMRYLSVREQRAVEIIKELTGRNADLTLDPTLLLEPEKWQKALKKPDVELDDQYICTYFLGEVPEAVKAFAKEKEMPIYALNSQNSPELFTLDPAEFLYMIQNATYVLTDSFHAVAFSIKFNKDFYVFDRKQDDVSNMFSRIETITKRFGLGNRIQNRDRIIEQDPINNWNEIEDELMAEKKKSMEKLLEAMGI